MLNLGVGFHDISVSPCGSAAAAGSVCFFWFCVVHTWESCFAGRCALTRCKLFQETRQGVTFAGLLLGHTRRVP